MKLQIGSSAAIPLNDPSIWTYVDSFVESPVIADQLEELWHSRLIQNEFAEDLLADRAVVRNLLYGVLNARIAWVQANVLEWELPMLDRNGLPIDGQSLTL
jgi:hypothetical protein